jgi:hypothetical protein
MTRFATILFCVLLAGCSTRQPLTAPLPQPQAGARAMVVPMMDTNEDVQTLTLSCLPVVGAAGYEFQQGMASRNYTNTILTAGPQVQFTNLPAIGQMFFDVLWFNALGQDSLASAEVTFSSWGCVVAITGSNAAATTSLTHPLWFNLPTPWVATNPPGSLFACGAGMKITSTPYPNP